MQAIGNALFALSISTSALDPEKIGYKLHRGLPKLSALWRIQARGYVDHSLHTLRSNVRTQIVGSLGTDFSLIAA
jgi:hypothetical protein